MSNVHHTFEKIINGIDRLSENDNPIHVSVQHKRPYKAEPIENFVLMFFRPFLFYLIEHKLSINDIKILLSLIEYSSYGNVVSVSYRKKISKDLNMDYSHVTKCIRKFFKIGLLINDNEITYLNPQIFCKGKLSNFENAHSLISKGEEVLPTGLGPSLISKEQRKELQKKEEDLLFGRGKLFD